MRLKVFSYPFILLVLCSQVYLPVYTHVCHGMGKTWASAIVKPDSCCRKKKPDDGLKGCHSGEIPSSGLQFNKLPCCESHSSCLGLGLQFTKHIPKAVVKILPHPDPIGKTPEDIFSSLQVPAKTYWWHLLGPPLARDGRAVLRSKQQLQC